MAGRRKFFGWGTEDQVVSEEETIFLARVFSQRFGANLPAPRAVPRESDFALRAPRLAPPPSLARLCMSDPYERLLHTYGKSYPDYVRLYRRIAPHPPDAVAYPESESDIGALLDWAAREKAAVVPFGGGSSVVGGVECDVGESYSGVVSLDMARMGKVLEIDRTSRAARIQAGAYGPALEAQLKPHELTLRHFPQSFEFSTLGGWIATRSGGHYATLYTHVDDFVEALRVVTPSGVVATRRLPGSGAGPSPERLFIGSEGILGIIVEAWMRLQDRPTFRASASVMFDDFASGAAAARAIAQAGLYPSNCRLLDPGEALTSGAGSGNEAVLLVAFESADHGLDAWMTRALECARDHGGQVPDGAGRTVATDEGSRDGAAGAWRRAFLDAPYLRDALVRLGMLSETFETAITWDRFA